MRVVRIAIGPETAKVPSLTLGILCVLSVTAVNRNGNEAHDLACLEESLPRPFDRKSTFLGQLVLAIRF